MSVKCEYCLTKYKNKTSLKSHYKSVKCMAFRSLTVVCRKCLGCFSGMDNSLNHFKICQGQGGLDRLNPSHIRGLFKNPLVYQKVNSSLDGIVALNDPAVLANAPSVAQSQTPAPQQNTTSQKQIEVIKEKENGEIEIKKIDNPEDFTEAPFSYPVVNIPFLREKKRAMNLGIKDEQEFFNLAEDAAEEPSAKNFRKLFAVPIEKILIHTKLRHQVPYPGEKIFRDLNTTRIMTLFLSPRLDVEEIITELFSHYKYKPMITKEGKNYTCFETKWTAKEKVTCTWKRDDDFKEAVLLLRRTMLDAIKCIATLAKENSDGSLPQADNDEAVLGFFKYYQLLNGMKNLRIMCNDEEMQKIFKKIFSQPEVDKPENITHVFLEEELRYNYEYQGIPYDTHCRAYFKNLSLLYFLSSDKYDIETKYRDWNY